MIRNLTAAVLAGLLAVTVGAVAVASTDTLPAPEQEVAGSNWE